MNNPPEHTCHQPTTSDHELVLQQVLLHLLLEQTADLQQLCEQADVPVLSDTTGEPVDITSVRNYHQAEILTLDKGVWIGLSDGSEFGFTITVGRHPTGHQP